MSKIPWLDASVTATGRSGCRGRAGAHLGSPVEDSCGTNEFGRVGAGSGQGTELGHRRAVASHDDAFAALDAAQDFSPIVPKIAHCHRVHIENVSPVRQAVGAVGVTPPPLPTGKRRRFIR